MSKLALTLPGFNTPTVDSNFITPTTNPNFDTLGGALSSSLEIVLYISSFLMFFWLLWGVFKYLTAEGSKEHLKNARNHMRWAFVGFIVILLSFILGQYVLKIIPQQPVPLIELPR